MNAESDDGGMAALVIRCAYAVLAGHASITVSAIGGKKPAGFPRGELLSVGTNGAHNYAVHPIKVLAWAHARTSKAAG